MSLPSLIYLVGMPGSGKTTLGEILATTLHYDFIDLDERIIAYEGMTIPEIFDKKGEAYFREIESTILKQTVKLRNTIISTGGGVPCFFDNMNFINQNGISIWLNVSPELLAKRIAASKGDRPMFQNQSFEEIIANVKQKLDERKKFYEQAHFKIDEPATLHNVLQVLDADQAN